MHHPGRSTDFTAYKALEHRHEPEILQALGSQFSSRNSMMFIPHLIPVSRGIFVTCYMTHQSEACAAIALESYRNFYKGSHFIRFRSKPPRLVDVIGTNFCDLHISVRGKQVAVMATLDNLVKGMAGQCVQNLNLLFGSQEDTGLLLPAIGPV